MIRPKLFTFVSFLWFSLVNNNSLHHRMWKLCRNCNGPKCLSVASWALVSDDASLAFASVIYNLKFFSSWDLNSKVKSCLDYVHTVQACGWLSPTLKHMLLFMIKEKGLFCSRCTGKVKKSLYSIGSICTLGYFAKTCYWPNKGIGDAGSTADFRMLWSAMVCLGLL